MKVLFTSALVCSLVVAAQAESKAPAELVKLGEALAVKLKAKDIAGFEKLLAPHVTPDFKYYEAGIGDGKPMDFKTMVSTMRQGMGMMTRVTSSKTRFVSFTAKGNSATGVEQHFMAFEMQGEKGKSHKLTFTGTSTNTYRKIGGTWKIAVMNMKQNDMTMDGKKMDPRAMGGK